MSSNENLVGLRARFDEREKPFTRAHIEALFNEATALSKDLATVQGQLDAAEHHVKILREQVASFAPADETTGDLERCQRVNAELVAELKALRCAPETTAPPLCDGEVHVVYEHGEPKGVRDATGYLCHLNRVPKWPDQEERYRKELALRAQQAEVIAKALRGAVKTKASQP